MPDSAAAALLATANASNKGHGRARVKKAASGVGDVGAAPTHQRSKRRAAAGAERLVAAVAALEGQQEYDSDSDAVVRRCSGSCPGPCFL
jgi:hypothetical protein